MINKLTGEPVSAEMQNVLKRLANSENVPEAEIQQFISAYCVTAQ